MLAAIETGTITDFVNDHPAEAYGIAGAVILLLILLLLINRRRKKERDGGEEVSSREARQAKKQAKADAKGRVCTDAFFYTGYILTKYREVIFPAFSGVYIGAVGQMSLRCLHGGYFLFFSHSLAC